VSTFRNWLLDRLLGTAWPNRVPDDTEKLEAMSLHLGVRTDLLIDLRKAWEEQQRLISKPTGKPIIAGHQMDVVMPQEVFNLYKEECSTRHMERVTALRSLVHAYLLGSTEPTALIAQWRWKGRYLKIEPMNYYKKHGKAWPWRFRVAIPHGAKRALERRADNAGVPPTSIVRGLVLDFLDGRWEGLVLVGYQQLFDDEDRYWIPPSVLALRGG
jgi:hypothetical protein